MTELASAHPQRAVSVRDIARQQRISAKYLEHIFQALKKAGLVRAVHGAHGGYVLAGPPERTTLKALFDSLGESIAPVACVDCPETCPLHEVCPTRDTWVEIKDVIESVLERTTVQDLAKRTKRQAIASAHMYHI
jgi:Rrf2 family protein